MRGCKRTHVVSIGAGDYRRSHMPGAFVPEDKLLSNQMSQPLALPLGLDRTDYFVDLSATIFIGQAGVFKIGFIYSHHARWMIALHQVHFPKSFKDPGMRPFVRLRFSSK